MNNLYLVRHGHTVWTGSGDIAGRTDVELSDEGVEAVKRLAASFSKDKAFTHWYCSPLKRTRASSALLREYMPQQSMGPLPIEALDERIVELDFGDWEGMNWTQVHKEHGQVLEAWGDDWINRSPPRGETFQQQVDRCSDWLKEALVQMQEVPESSAMVVSHGGSVRALLCLCLGWPLTEAMQVSIDPASLCWLSRRSPDDAWHVRMINSQFA